VTISQFPTPSERYDDPEQFARAVVRSIRQITTGKTNNVLDVTLTANSTTTSVIDARIGVHTAPIFVPTSANAQAIATPRRDFSSPVNGSMTVVHANDANTDKTFKVILIG